MSIQSLRHSYGGSKGVLGAAQTGELGPAFGTAMGDLAPGYILAAVVGIGVGVLMGRNAVVERVLNPYVNFFQATPLIALVPLVVIWFGVGFEARWRSRSCSRCGRSSSTPPPG